MFESMWSSMTSSMQLAEECLKQGSSSEKEAEPLEGLEMFAQTIDSSKNLIKNLLPASASSYFRMFCIFQSSSLCFQF